MDYGGIGRGRRRSGSGSSSSAESSQERPTPKRIPSPAVSEDGDTTMRPIENDDTPPPESRPLIRQAMAFSADRPLETINTYQANVLATVAKPTFYLPGQKVPAPPKPKPPKKPKRAEAYPGQTTKFRLNSSYDPTPGAAPPIVSGDGPYSSQFRGVISPPKTTAQRSSPAVSVTPTVITMQVTATQNLADGQAQNQPSPNAVAVAPTKAKKPRASVKDKEKKKPQQAGKQAPSFRHISDHHISDHPGGYTPNQLHQAPSAHSSSYHNSNHSTGGGPYYRRDYESDSYHGRSLSPSAGQYQYQASRNPQNGHDPYYHQRSGNYASPERRSNKLRMVTILIQDMRSGTVDHQLVEVKVQLRPGEEPEDGFWADAKEISHELQRGPWRIDGPARAYTLRGKYRQIILRVSAKNEDEFLPANVVIQPDRTLDLVVEMLPLPGEPPPPPMIPPELLSPAYDDSTAPPSERMDIDTHGQQKTPRQSEINAHRGPQSAHRQSSMNLDSHRDPYDIRRQSQVDIDLARQSQDTQRTLHERGRDGRKRTNSGSFDDYDGPSPTHQHPVLNKVPRQDYDYEQSPNQVPRHLSPYQSRPSSGNDRPPSRYTYTPDHPSTSPHPISPLPRAHAVSPSRPSPPRPPRSPSPRAEPLHAPRGDQPGPDEVEIPKNPFIAELEKLLQKDPKWSDYFRAKSGRKVSDVIAQYEYITQNDLLRTYIPGYDRPVSESDIMKAMKIEDDEDFAKYYRETLSLLVLYGKGGRYEHQKVVNMLNDPDPSQVGSGGNAHKRINHLLKDVDKARSTGQQ